MATARVNGVTHYYEETGSGSPPGRAVRPQRERSIQVSARGLSL